ncbi:MAG: hypothetical protein ACI9XO_003558 [Paraglaciecola sp.]|jgi:hypothetical protein
MYLFFKDIVAKDIVIRHEVKKYGGAYKMMERLQMGGVGLGGMRYMEGVPEIEKIRNVEDTIVANFEMMREAFVIRFRNVEFHSMVLSRFSEVKSVHLYKEADVIRVRGRSLFKTLLNNGVAYETARIFATPRQLIHLGKIRLTIIIGEETIVFKNIEGFTGKVSKYFKNPIFKGKYTEDVTAYEIFEEA